MNPRSFALGLVLGLVSLAAAQQTANVIPANEAAAHVNEWSTVEGAKAKDGYTDDTEES